MLKCFGEGQDQGDEPIKFNQESPDARILHVIVVGMKHSVKYIYYYKAGETFGEVGRSLQKSLLGMGGDMKFKMNDSYLEDWQTVSSVCSPNHYTVYVIPVLKGGDKALPGSPAPDLLARPVREAHVRSVGLRARAGL